MTSKRQKEFLKALHKITGRPLKHFSGKRNPLPAILSALETGAGSALGGAAGMEAFQKVTKKKKGNKNRTKPAGKKAKARGKSRLGKSRKVKGRNPSITHALAVGRGSSPRIIGVGTKLAVAERAKLLRKAGVAHVQIGRRVPEPNPKTNYAVVDRDGFFRDYTRVYSAHATKALAVRAATKYRVNIPGNPKNQSSAMVIEISDAVKGQKISRDAIRRVYPVVW